jgi:hypothetical protein
LLVRFRKEDFPIDRFVYGDETRTINRIWKLGMSKRALTAFTRRRPGKPQGQGLLSTYKSRISQ